MKVKEIIEKKDKDLLTQIKELETKLTKLKFEIATKESNQAAEVSKIRKSVARIKTILREREITRKEENHEKKA
jgi:large subunit ribosomal protein L29